jgi:transcriptional regulator with XRE-family HTH domain
MTDPRVVEALGARIKRLRQEKGLPQDRLALRANVDQSGLSKFERGQGHRLGPVPLKRIAAVLGVTYEELVDGTDFDR